MVFAIPALISIPVSRSYVKSTMDDTRLLQRLECFSPAQEQCAVYRDDWPLLEDDCLLLPSRSELFGYEDRDFRSLVTCWTRKRHQREFAYGRSRACWFLGTRNAGTGKLGRPSASCRPCKFCILFLLEKHAFLADLANCSFFFLFSFSPFSFC